MQLSDIARVLSVPLAGADPLIFGAGIDSRTIGDQQLFVALDGEHTRGVRFVADAARHGAAAALVGEAVDHDLPQLVVEDSLAALQALADFWRQQVSPRVVAITGSNGKTTMRSLVAACLGEETLATTGNYNNHIGVPLMLLRLESTHQRAVFELGANHAGEIAEMAAWVRPDIAIITNAGPAHLEGFGSIEGVAHAKGELFAALGEGATAVINADDDYADLWRELAAPAAIRTFGSGAHADFWFDQWQGDSSSQQFVLHTPTGEDRVRLALSGRHNAMNATGAAAVADAVGIGFSDILARLANVAAEPGRQRLRQARNGWCVFDDSYNANPASMKAAAQTVAAAGAHAWMVIGDMGELGEQSESLHFATGAAIREAGVERLFALGDAAAHAVPGFGEGARAYRDIDSLLADLQAESALDITLLVKGSRSMRMERVVAALCDQEGV